MFEIKENNVLISITAKPNSHKFKILIDEEEQKRDNSMQPLLSDENRIIVCLKNSPENNKANMELIKELKRLFKKEVSLISGGKAKKKKLLIHNITESELRSALSQISD
ncbi:putative ACR, YggU family [uncultured archaeon]|nr:putative ACR, YggU family [uncultured archaeon]